MINKNKNLIYYICSKYNGYKDKEDMYQVGMIGLLNAYKNYDESKNVKFSTYAYNYILGEISKYVREDRSIKIGRDVIRLGNKLREYMDKHKQVRGYIPSINELSTTFDITKDKIILALESLNDVKSLESNINANEDITLLDVTPSIEKVEKETLIDLKDALNYLENDEKSLIMDRYYKDLTQSEVANNLGVNQVYVSRLEKKILKKLKNKITN